jgi:hypothetical protein
MNYGVDWTAPPGTAVVAAYAGKISFVGKDDKLGSMVIINHDNGTQTVYANLKVFDKGAALGQTVHAGQIIGYVGQTDISAESKLHFRLLRDNRPVDPFGEYQARVEKGGAIEAYVYRITTIESGNRCDAKNPLSSAAGLGQFINSTWLRVMADYRPDLIQGKTRAQILAMRMQCDLAREMTTAFTRENANIIRGRGHAVTPGNLYLAHFLGSGGAAKALGSSPDARVIDVFGADLVRANPFLSGRTISELIGWAARKMAGGSKKIRASAEATPGPETTQPAQENTFTSNPEFAAFRSMIDSLLN